jgi:hypothetical protein
MTNIEAQEAFARRMADVRATWSDETQELADRLEESFGLGARLSELRVARDSGRDAGYLMLVRAVFGGEIPDGRYRAGVRRRGDR